MTVFRIPLDAKTVPHQKHWQFCVGSGHALLALRTDYTRQLKFIRDQLGIRYVRFHGILHDDMNTFNTLNRLMALPGAEAFTEYNFNACGVAYDNVLEAGMKPFVELSFMPRDLMARDVQGLFWYRPNIAPPKDLKAWADYIRAFVRFLLHRYGAEEVRTWFFEVWNEPDLVGPFFAGTRDEYFALYEATARAIKDVDPLLRVGGPATSGSKWVAAFVKFCRENGVPVDFVTTHQYAGDPLGGVEDQGDTEEGEVPKEWSDEGFRIKAEQLAALEDKTFLNGFRTLMPDKSETEDLPNDVFRTQVKVVRQQAEDYPLYYTEWNENAIFSANTNDTRKVAAYDVKTALDVAGFLDGSSIWCFSDIFEELHPFPQEFHGGFGLLSQNGIPKPVFHAMKMLADAGDVRVDLGEDATDGEVGIAAFRKGENTQVLLFRQKMKNLDLPMEEVTVRVALPEEPARVTVRRVDETHGNPLAVWEQMGSPVSLNRAEVEEIKAKSAVTAEPAAFAWEDGEAVIRTSLGVNDVVFFELKPSAKHRIPGRLRC